MDKMTLTKVAVVLGAGLALGTACKKGEASSGPAEKKAPEVQAPEVKAPPALAGPDALVARYHECWGFVVANDATRLAGCFTDDAVGEISGLPPFKGGKQIAEQLFGGFLSAFSAVEFEPQLLLVNGHDAAVVNWFHGVNSAPMMGAPPTGKPVSFLGMRSMTFTEDQQKMTWDLHVADLGGVMAQLGMSPAPHRPVMDAAPGKLVTVIASDSPAERDDVAVIQKGCDLFNQHDAAGFGALLADDVLIADQTAPADVKGRDGAVAVFKAIFAAFPDIHGTCTAWAAGDYVVNQVDWTATQTGASPELGLPKATGKAVKIHDSEVYKLANGKIVEYWRFSNSAHMAMQLGLVPPPPAAPPASK
jgi:steroid delta-isomerase-like uncharacterized protein